WSIFSLCRLLCTLLLALFSHFSLQHPSPTVFSTLSLHDALPIYVVHILASQSSLIGTRLIAPLPSLYLAKLMLVRFPPPIAASRSEEHTSELQSLRHLVCRLLLEKKKQKTETAHTPLND